MNAIKDQRHKGDPRDGKTLEGLQHYHYVHNTKPFGYCSCLSARQLGGQFYCGRGKEVLVCQQERERTGE